MGEIEMTTFATAGQIVPEDSFSSLLDRLPREAELLSWEGVAFTAGEIRQRVGRLAHGLADLGLRRGDRIAVMLPNSPTWVVLVFAAARLGVAIVSLNPRLGAKEVRDLVVRTGAVALVHDSGYRNGASSQALATAGELPSLRHVIDARPEPRAGLVAGAPVSSLTSLDLDRPDEISIGRAGDPLLILATSGTTSLPKLVVHLQGRVARHVRHGGRVLGLDEASSRVLLMLPLCGAFGFTVGFTTIAAGAVLSLRDGFAPEADVTSMQAERITTVFGTNDMLLKLLQATEARRPFPNLRYYGHANFTPGLDDLPAEADARGVRVRGCFGMTETLALFSAQPDEAPLSQRQHGGGFPVDVGAAFRIRDPETGVLVGAGEVGLLEVSTPNIMAQYLDDSESTQAAFSEDGYFRTGDIARKETDGSFTFIARHSDVLRIGGYLVSPVEIEDVIRRHAAVTACQVVSVALPEGVRPVAFLVLEAGVQFDEARLERACRSDLAIYKVPVRFFVLDSLPVTDGPNGSKVKKSALREMAKEMIVK